MEDENVPTSKFVLKSKTILGGLIAAVPGIGTALGVEIPELHSIQQSLFSVLDHFNELVGLALVAWGRVTATTDLVLKG